ncbi:MAG TPA: DUF655 domain-containing protein [Nitrososphaeraceae archaeon]|nr:DUF655 domain-containing protein [Nitrososphaeraceae archaeon]
MKFSTLERIYIDSKYDAKIISVMKRLYFKDLSVKAKQKLKAAINYIVFEKGKETDLIKQT